MTGPDHYAEAERLVVLAAADHVNGARSSATLELAAAQVHATLALVAAAIFPDVKTVAVQNAWTDATS